MNEKYKQIRGNLTDGVAQLTRQRIRHAMFRGAFLKLTNDFPKLPHATRRSTARSWMKQEWIANKGMEKVYDSTN